ncbi:MAG: hypothetical protein DRN53_02185 [Thermoprotei archaeon]|nr:MAG: hypothetical protein DRN53_02185 [Thermoprotei archaeon]
MGEIRTVDCPPNAEKVEEMLKDIEKIEKQIIKAWKRSNVVMTRLNDEDMAKVDALVEVGIFDSRSEAVAFLVHEGIKARKDIFDKIMPIVNQIQELRKKAKEALKQGK